MQVRKYEASTIKEAVDMVKRDLGPDAIILSTREAQRNGGLATNKRVMITAAVSEDTLNRKRTVEENLTQKQRDLLMNKSVRVQREFINQSYSNLKDTIDDRRRKLENRNYASIPDEDFYDDEIPMAPQRVKPSAPVPARKSAPAPQTAEKRVKDAVAEAFKMGREFANPGKIQQAKNSMAKAAAAAPAIASKNQAPDSVTIPKQDPNKIEELKSEIQRLQAMVQNMKSSVKTGVSAPSPSYPGSRQGLSIEVSGMFERMLAEGLDEKILTELLKNAQMQLKDNVRRQGLLESYLAKTIYNNIEVVNDKMQARIHVFVGPRGVGKTSTLVKMASHLAIKERKRVAIITSDNNKVGASEQLRIYSQILNVPFAIWRKGEDINVYLQQLSGCDHILIDTEGQSLLQMEEIETLRNFIPYHLGNIRVHLVMSAMLREEDLFSVGRRFKSVNYHDVIITNIDQVRKHGVMVSLQQHLRSPYFAFATGPMIPEDFEWASKERVLDLIFKMSKQKRDGE